jgi:hypothetical protein
MLAASLFHKLSLKILTHSLWYSHNGMLPPGPTIFPWKLGLIHSKWKLKRTNEKQSACAVYFDAIELLQATFKVSLHLSNIYRRKGHLSTQWQQPVTWQDQYWCMINFKLSGDRIGSKFVNIYKCCNIEKLVSRKWCQIYDRSHTNTIKTYKSKEHSLQ